MNAEGRRINRLDILCFAAFGLLLAVILAAGVRSQTDRYSCHICRGLKAIHTNIYYGFVLEQGITNHEGSRRCSSSTFVVEVFLYLPQWPLALFRVGRGL